MTPENTNITNINRSTKPSVIQALATACDEHYGIIKLETGQDGQRQVVVNGKVVYSTDPGEENSVKP